MISWLFARRLVDLGLPGDPVVSYAAVGILSSAAGVIALRLVEARIERAAAARRAYVVGCLVGAAGLVMLALAPDVIVGGIGLLLASGVAFSVTRAVSVIWVNRRTPSEIRATIHSFLSQAETIGEVVGGLALVVTAQAAGLSAAFIASGACIACIGALVANLRVRSQTVDARQVPGRQRPAENTAHSE
jgi:sugar phosphate permease